MFWHSVWWDFRPHLPARDLCDVRQWLADVDIWRMVIPGHTACGEISSLIHLHVISVMFGSNLLTLTSGGWLSRVTQHRCISPLPSFITIFFLYHSLPYHLLSSFASLFIRRHYADPSVYYTITSLLPFIDISFIPFCPFICHSLSYYHFLLKHACTSCCHFMYIILSFMFPFHLFLSLSFIPVICTSLRYCTYLVILFLERLFPFCNFRSFIIVSLQSSLSFPYVE